MNKRPIVFHLADSSMERGLKAFFNRDHWHDALRCSRFDIDVDEDFLRVPEHTDGGLLKYAHQNLATYLHSHERAVIILDEDFDPYPGAEEICEDITKNMLGAGWSQERFEVVVIEPMLEAWLWADNLNVAHAFGYESFEQLQAPLIAKGLWDAGEAKPKRERLKDAKKAAMKFGNKKLNGSPFPGLFKILSSRAFDACQEPSFGRMRQRLQEWFPVEGSTT